MRNIAIFASGTGTNAERIISYFQAGNTARVRLILCNKSTAGVVERAKKYGIECQIFSPAELKETSLVLDWLEEYEIDYIVLAGFLLLLPSVIIDRYGDRIVNIHPSLLPKFGGKGMYGERVHAAVIEAGESRSGITIHHVNGQLDEGAVIFQAEVPVLPGDTPETLAARIHELEYTHYPRIIEQEILKIQ